MNIEIGFDMSGHILEARSAVNLFNFAVIL